MNELNLIWQNSLQIKKKKNKNEIEKVDNNNKKKFTKQEKIEYLSTLIDNFLRSNTIEETTKKKWMALNFNFFPVYLTSIATTKHQNLFSACISKLVFLWF